MTRLELHPRRWREVTMAELRRVWAYLRRKGILFNGCTHAELERRYSAANVKHVWGHGWYKLTRRP